MQLFATKLYFILLIAAKKCLLEKFEPDYIIVAAEDITQVLLKASLSISKCPVICIAQTPSLLPFGSHSFYPDPQKTSILKQVDAFVVNIVSQIKIENFEYFLGDGLLNN